MKVRLYIDTGYPSCEHEDVIEVEDDITDAELDEIARENMGNYIDWGWEKLDA
jgi:hypothetical protein